MSLEVAIISLGIGMTTIAMRNQKKKPWGPKGPLGPLGPWGQRCRGGPIWAIKQNRRGHMSPIAPFVPQNLPCLHSQDTRWVVVSVFPWGEGHTT